MARSTALAIIVLTLILVTASGTIPQRSPKSEAPAQAPTRVIRVEAEDPHPGAKFSRRDEQELVDFAYERFGRADLELPAVDIVFISDIEQCEGYGGLYTQSRNMVRICRSSEVTMVHELAHAWVAANLTDEDQQHFLELRGLDTWNGGDDWDRRGTEHAAEIITWALMDHNMSIRWVETNVDGTTVNTWRLFKIPNSSPDELVVAYHSLTGHQPDNRLADDPRGDQILTDTPNRGSRAGSGFSPEARRVDDLRRVAR